MAKARRARRKALLKKKKPLVSGHAKPSTSFAARVLSKHRAKAEEPVRDVIDQSRSWYIIRTFPGHEERVEKRVIEARLGSVYRPREMVKRGRRGRIWHTTRHLMPRHMFFGCDRGADPNAILSDVQGFYEVMRFNGRDVRITSMELQRFADVVSGELAPLAGAGKMVLKKDDEVVIGEGPFVGFKAVVMSPAKGGFVKLSISVFGSTSEITAPIAELLAA